MFAPFGLLPAPPMDGQWKPLRDTPTRRVPLQATPHGLLDHRTHLTGCPSASTARRPPVLNAACSRSKVAQCPKPHAAFAARSIR
jgi:hypothetical protein